MDADVGELWAFIEVVTEKEKDLARVLGPVMRQIERLKDELKRSYRYREVEEADGRRVVKVLGFRGERIEVRSMRAVAVKGYERGEDRKFEYVEKAVRVVIPDQTMVAARAALFRELSEIAQHYGKDINQLRTYRADIRDAKKAVARLMARPKKEARREAISL